MTPMRRNASPSRSVTLERLPADHAPTLHLRVATCRENRRERTSAARRHTFTVDGGPGLLCRLRDEAGRDITQLHVPFLRKLDQQTEGAVRINVVSAHQQPLRLPDLEPGEERLLETVDLELCLVNAAGRSIAVVCRTSPVFSRRAPRGSATTTVIEGVSPVPGREVAIGTGDEPVDSAGVAVVGSHAGLAVALGRSDVTRESCTVPSASRLVASVSEGIPVNGNLVSFGSERS
jgi:hypothetical protein